MGLLRFLERTIAECVMAMGPPAVTRRPPLKGLMWASWRDEPDGGRRLVSRRVWGSFRLMKGMVLTNQPWRTAPQLSGVLAAAATGAFGIFYNSIWQMSDALSWWRLLFTGVIAGALGSSFDSRTDVRSITHGQPRAAAADTRRGRAGPGCRGRHA